MVYVIIASLTNSSERLPVRSNFASYSVLVASETMRRFWRDDQFSPVLPVQRLPVLQFSQAQYDEQTAQYEHATLLASDFSPVLPVLQFSRVQYEEWPWLIRLAVRWVLRTVPVWQRSRWSHAVPGTVLRCVGS